MKNLAVKSLVLTTWLVFSASAHAMIVWEPLGSGAGYFGGNGNAQGGDIVGTADSYDILKLEAVQSWNNLTISVLTNFSEGQLLDPNGPTYSNVIFGDLMLATGTDPWHPDPTGDPTNFSYDTASSTNPGHTQWNYVVQSLHPGAPYEPGPYVSGSMTGLGDIYSVTTANLLNSNAAGALQDGVRRDDQYIGLGTGGTNTMKTAAISIESVAIEQPYDLGNFIQGTLLTYTINLADLGLGPDFTNTEVAIRWTMTCANDIVEGVLNLAAVSEPETLALFLGGLASLGALRRSRHLAKPAQSPRQAEVETPAS